LSGPGSQAGGPQRAGASVASRTPGVDCRARGPRSDGSGTSLTVTAPIPGVGNGRPQPLGRRRLSGAAQARSGWARWVASALWLFVLGGERLLLASQSMRARARIAGQPAERSRGAPTKEPVWVRGRAGRRGWQDASPSRPTASFLRARSTSNGSRLGCTASAQRAGAARPPEAQKRDADRFAHRGRPRAGGSRLTFLSLDCFSASERFLAVRSGRLPFGEMR